MAAARGGVAVAAWVDHTDEAQVAALLARIAAERGPPREGTARHLEGGVAEGRRLRRGRQVQAQGPEPPQDGALGVAAIPARGDPARRMLLPRRPAGR